MPLIIPISLCLLLWGLSVFLPKLIIDSISPQSLIVYEVLGGVIIAIIILFSIGFKPDFSKPAMAISMLAGACGVLGTLAFFYAISKSDISIIFPITSLYPVIVIILAVVFLKEEISVQHGIGIICAMVGVYLLSK